MRNNIILLPGPYSPLCNPYFTHQPYLFQPTAEGLNNIKDFFWVFRQGKIFPFKIWNLNFRGKNSPLYDFWRENVDCHEFELKF